MMIDLYPKLTELDLLLGVVPVLTPWAYFLPPKKFAERRRSPFTFSRVLPSLGASDKEDEEELDKIAAVPCQTSAEKSEKAMITMFFKQRQKINDWLMHIVKQVGRFISS